MSVLRAALPLLLIPLLGAQAPTKPLAPPPGAEAGSATFDVDQMRDWLRTLASEEFGGRGTGQDGFQKAAELVRDHFEQLGLRGGGDDGTFWQRVPWGKREIDAGATGFVVRQGEETLLKRGPTSGLGGMAGGDYEASGPIALLRVADAREPEITQRPAAGDIVIVTAEQGFQRGNMRALFTAMTSLSRALSESQPAAVLFADDELLAQWPQLSGSARPSRRVNPGAAGRGVSPNMFAVAEATMDRLLEAAGKQPADLVTGAALRLDALAADVRVKIRETDAPAWNVIGILPGSDPKLKDEYVVVGSHLDHLGRRGNTIFPGADDDASGSTGILAIAQAFARNDVKPKRSILFVTFCGEESGLVGSRYFVDHPPIPLESIVAELQIDMIGRNEEHHPSENRTNETAEENLNSLHLIGTKKLSNDLHELCVSANEKHAGFDLEWDQEGVYFRSDHYNFARKGVPIAFFFTGFHRDYHQPTDTYDKIDFAKLARVSKYVFHIAWELAQQDSRPLIEPELWKDDKNAPAAPLRKQ